VKTFVDIAGPFLGMGGGVLLAAGFITLLRLARGESLRPRPLPPRPVTATAAPVEYVGFYDAHTTVETPLGLIVMGFRYCPAEHQTVAAIVHPDGSATCADGGCGAHIPTTQEGAL
jgi:hypothetical protein